MLNQKEKEYLRDIYFNPKKPASFSGIEKIYYYVQNDGKFKISRKDIAKWLKYQEVHTTNILPKRKIKRQRVITPYIDYMWDIDTASFRDYQKENGGYGYFILAIDIMSRFVWCEPIKSPTGKEVKRVLQKIFKLGRQPEKLRSDKGSEFSNTVVRKFLKKRNIDHFVTQNEVKANYSERAIQTIKGKLMRYMRSKQTHRWIGEIENVTFAYNNTLHRSIKQTPTSVTKDDEIKLWKYMYYPKKTSLPKKIEFKFDIGDIVRISQLRRVFQRYYDEHWTNELFIIKEREIKQYIPIYKVTDYAGEKIEGIFYEGELQQVFVDENTVYKIEKVIKKRTRKGTSESLVKWLGWPKKFNSWINTEDIGDYK